MREDSFSRRVFEKVFDEDIRRLRSMEDMWKSRPIPTPLAFPNLSPLADTLSAASILNQDQRSWSSTENLVVFRDRQVAPGRDLRSLLILRKAYVASVGVIWKAGRTTPPLSLPLIRMTQMRLISSLRPRICARPSFTSKPSQGSISSVRTADRTDQHTR